MADWTCISCGKQIGIFDEKCKYCGEAQYDEVEDEPIEKISVEDSKRILKRNGLSMDNGCDFNRNYDYTSKRAPLTIFSDEEKLALGLYPKDEGMKMSLISRILNK